MKQRQKITRRKCPSEDFPKNRYFPNYAILHRHLYGFLNQLKQSSSKQRVNTGTMNFLQYILDRSSHKRCSKEIGVLKNFTKFTIKHLCQSLFFNKAAGLVPFIYPLKTSENFWFFDVFRGYRNGTRPAT